MQERKSRNIFITSVFIFALLSIMCHSWFYPVDESLNIVKRHERHNSDTCEGWPPRGWRSETIVFKFASQAHKSRPFPVKLQPTMSDLLTVKCRSLNTSVTPSLSAEQLTAPLTASSRPPFCSPTELKHVDLLPLATDLTEHRQQRSYVFRS